MNDPGRRLRVGRTVSGCLRLRRAAWALLPVVWLLFAAPAPAAEPADARWQPEVMPLHSGTHGAVVKTRGREGARQPFLLLEPPKPRAAAVLFPGGGGDVGLRDDGFLRHEGNFLVRSRKLFVEQGLAVAVLDVPTDRATMRGGFRTTREHLLDVGSVVAFLRARLHVPVWLVGTSRGTVSASYAAAHLTGPGAPDGLVLASSVFSGRQATVFDAPPAAIRVPTLLVHHRKDACRVTRLLDAGPFLAALVHARPHELIVMEGGGPPRGQPCRGSHYHGFIGRERVAVTRIVRWIDARLAQRPAPVAK